MKYLPFRVAFPVQANQDLHPFGVVNWYQTCLKRVKHRLVHQLDAARYCVIEIRIQIISTASRGRGMLGASQGRLIIYPSHLILYPT